MHVSQVHCPHCATVLRIRDRKYVGRKIRCPDCREPLRILADGPRGLAVERIPRPVPRHDERRKRRLRQHPLMSRASALPAALFRRSKTAVGWFTNPLVISWTVAGGTAVALIITVAGPWGGPSATTVPAEDAPVPADVDERAQPPPAAENNPDQPPPSDNSQQQPLRQRLGRLGDRLLQYEQDHGHFPRGTVAAEDLAPHQRFSWLAALAAEHHPAGTGPPLWDQPWNNPLNAPFVRRRIPDYQNPAIRERVGADGYPAGHFAGIAGVGEDAPRLPVDHPRAGIFGYNRRTTLEDIKDGASNTMMVAGVRDRLGSWAAGGRPSLRALTREPYINGPDGLGTGQPDGMHVLMADGSVRFLSQDTDPRILRRMAAMADGHDLQLQTPGDRPLTEPPPREPPAVAGTEPAAPPDAPAEGQPSRQPVAAPRPDPQPPEAPPVDVRAALAQPVLEFRQPQPVPFENILIDVEEMAGVPIRAELDPELPPEVRSKPVSLHLRRTTVGGILEALLKKVGLRYTIQNNEIHLHRIEK